MPQRLELLGCRSVTQRLEQMDWGLLQHAGRTLCSQTSYYYYYYYYYYWNLAARTFRFERKLPNNYLSQFAAFHPDVLIIAIRMLSSTRQPSCSLPLLVLEVTACCAERGPRVGRSAYYTLYRSPQRKCKTTKNYVYGSP